MQKKNKEKKHLKDQGSPKIKKRFKKIRKPDQKT